MAFPISKTSIQDLFPKILHNTLILPALQREFVWKPKDICKLFDSLMQGYPINTMMFWRTGNLNNQPIEFYQFLKAKYIENKPNQEPFAKNNVVDSLTQYDIVIDGQQRITSLLIGLTGSYQTPKGKEQKLYLRLDKPRTNGELVYDFQFLTDSKLKSNQKNNEIWFRVSVESLNNSFNLFTTINKLGLQNNDYAQQTLDKLRLLVADKDVINYYEITNDNIDDVLEIFVRTNSGGYTLKKGDLLMSALTVNWANLAYNLNAREYVDGIIRMVEQKKFKVDKDWVFNVFLMLTGANMGLKPSAFMSNNIPQNIYKNNQLIKDSIAKAFDLVSDFHLVEKGLTTKLAIIPLVYFIYKYKLQKTAILATNQMQNVFSDTRKFVFRAIVKNLFEASTDEILKNIRDIIDNSSNSNYFPYAEIEQMYSKLCIQSSDYKDLIETRKQNAFPVLNIIYALGYEHGLCTMKPSSSDIYDVDHMHPKATFINSAALATILFNTPHDRQIANNEVIYDTIANLELLDADTNRSKNKKPLKEWINNVKDNEQKRLRAEHFFVDLPIGIEDFGTFIDKRREQLQNVLQYL